jgi:hypothetical protein
MSDLELEDVVCESVGEAEIPGRAARVAARTHGQEKSGLIFGVRIGVLIGLKAEGSTPLVTYPGQPGDSVMAARASIDLHGGHIGREVVLMFEGGDPTLPIVVGCIVQNDGTPPPALAGQLQVDADGERLVLTAKEQLVLRCGQASITLTKSGKVLIQGTYVSSRSSGVQRLIGGSVQIN